MPNITLALDERTIAASREYARKLGKTLNGLIRELLEKTTSNNSDAWLSECFELMDQAAEKRKTRTSGRWKREDAYDL